MMRMRTGLIAAALTGLLALTACGGPGASDDLGLNSDATTEPAGPTESSPAPGTGAPASCDDATASYDPLPEGTASIPADSTIAQIRDRGTIVAGVSADTLLMGARNPFTGELEGFDIDIVRDLSTAIFGDPDHVTYRVITAGERISSVAQGDVDVVVRAFTVTCGRWQDIAFSTVYFEAGQKALIADTSEAQDLADLAGQRVCAPAGTTTLERLSEYDVEPVPAATHSACLALFQLGRVDAITGDDTILAGFAAQDPHAKVIGQAISSEPYGIGVAAENVDLVRFINALLAERVADGRWQASYDTWLAPALGDDAAAPAPSYGRSA